MISNTDLSVLRMIPIQDGSYQYKTEVTVAMSTTKLQQIITI